MAQPESADLFLDMLMRLGAPAYLEDWVEQQRAVEHAQPVCSSSASKMTTRNFIRSLGCHVDPRQGPKRLWVERWASEALCVFSGLLRTASIPDLGVDHQDTEPRHRWQLACTSRESKTEADPHIVRGSTACFHARCAEASLQRQVFAMMCPWRNVACRCRVLEESKPRSPHLSVAKGWARSHAERRLEDLRRISWAGDKTAES